LGGVIYPYKGRREEFKGRGIKAKPADIRQRN